MSEQPILHDMDLPEDLGRDWEWFVDLNVIGLRRGLTCRQKKAAIIDLTRAWRRTLLQLVQSACADGSHP